MKFANHFTHQLGLKTSITPGDWDGFATLVTNNLANMVILPAILMGTFAFPADIVFGRILPGLSLTLLVGMYIFARFANRLRAQEQRDDVTALPYGISTPVMFVYVFGVMGPVYFATEDPLRAYQIGLGAAFIGGLIEISGAIIGPWLERLTPQVGLLGTIAGVSIVWIAMVPSAIIFANPIIGLPSLFVVLLGLIGIYQFPMRLPAGIVAAGLGISLGLFTGDAVIDFKDVGFHLPLPFFNDLWTGVRLILSEPEILAVVIPIEIYNFIETSGNVESARAAGDDYDVRQCHIVDGCGTLLGAVFGSPLPTTVHIGHPAYKQMGARTGYMWLTGIFLFGASLMGLYAFLQQLIPAAAVAPLLVFVGIVITNYAFQATPSAHGAAIGFALIPHIADLLKKQLDGTLLEVLQQGTATPELMAGLAEHQGVYLQSYGLLSQGAIIIGLLWGAILAFLIDHKWINATVASFVAMLLSMTGIIHAAKIGLSLTPITTGYLVLTVVLAMVYLNETYLGGATAASQTESAELDPMGLDAISVAADP